MASDASRQAILRKRRRAEGYVQIAVWVPAEHASSMTLIAKDLCADKALEPGPLRNTATGKFQKWAK